MQYALPYMPHVVNYKPNHQPHGKTYKEERSSEHIATADHVSFDGLLLKNMNLLKKGLNWNKQSVADRTASHLILV